MFNGADHSRKLNMKVAGTLNRTHVKKAHLAAEDSSVPEESKEGTDQKKKMDGLTAKQKKNLKKKLARKRKKLQ